jgi:hypothetical protein
MSNFHATQQKNKEPRTRNILLPKWYTVGAKSSDLLACILRNKATGEIDQKVLKRPTRSQAMALNEPTILKLMAYPKIC